MVDIFEELRRVHCVADHATIVIRLLASQFDLKGGAVVSEGVYKARVFLA
jgi:hypothetical protein